MEISCFYFWSACSSFIVQDSLQNFISFPNAHILMLKVNVQKFRISFFVIITERIGNSHLDSYMTQENCKKLRKFSRQRKKSLTHMFERLEWYENWKKYYLSKHLGRLQGHLATFWRDISPLISHIVNTFCVTHHHR